MSEKWRDVQDSSLKGLYSVSNLGRVRSDRSGDILEPYYNEKRRYYYISCQKPGYRKNFILHRLVAEAFIENPNNYPCVDHINFNTKDNRACNLQWVTHKQNHNRSMDAGRFPDKSGENSKLSEADVAEIYKMRFYGSTHKEIADKFGIKQCSVSLIVNGHRWPHMGYKGGSVSPRKGKKDD